MLSKLLFFIERASAYLLGKGGGGRTVAKEFSSTVKLLQNKKPLLCIDIGGNQGVYTQEIVKQFPDCKVVVFEPSESNIEVLNNKFLDNQNIIIEQAAISNITGDATLYSNEDGSPLASLTKRRLDHFGIDFEKTENITTIRFEDYWKSKLGSKKIDFCKIDIEGHELDALVGFGNAIDNISVIQFEFGGCNIDTKTYFQDFWYFFDRHDFKIYRISPIGLIHIERYQELDEVFITTNYLAKRN